MRVAYICADPGVPVFGHKGCSIHVQEVLRSLCRHGARVELFANRVGGAPEQDLKRVKLNRLPRLPGRGVAGRESACIAANQSLRRALERSNSFDLLYERYSLWSWAGLDYARERKRPGLLEVNAPLIEESRTHRRLSDEREALRISLQAFSAASQLIAVSQELARYVEHLGVPSDKIQVVPNGVNLERFTGLPPSLESGSRPFTVGFCGSLRPWHDLPTLLEGFRLLHQSDETCRLLVVGDGPGASWLSEQIAGTPLRQAVILRGGVSGGEVPALLKQMDVGVAPYPALTDFYFSPLKIYEYMATGLPIVTAGIGQPGRLIQDGVSGLLYAPGVPAALGECLLRLRRDAELRSRLGKTALRVANTKHSWDRRVERILEIAGADAPSPVGVE